MYVAVRVLRSLSYQVTVGCVRCGIVVVLRVVLRHASMLWEEAGFHKVCTDDGLSGECWSCIVEDIYPVVKRAGICTCIWSRSILCF